MKIKSAEFIMSNSNVTKAPKDRIPEYAFIGRSNVGKSSLINMLMGRKDLAKISGKPGKTQLINHFKINDDWFLVDLPGYGYAKISKKKRTIFQYFIENYFKEREQLVCTFVLIDSRHDPQKIDLEFMKFLGRKSDTILYRIYKGRQIGKLYIKQTNCFLQKEIIEQLGNTSNLFCYFIINRSG